MFGKARFTHLDSLVKHASVYKTEASAIFVGPQVDKWYIGSDAITVIYNYGTGLPTHEATWYSEISPSWRKWNTLSGWHNTEYFLSFLEDNIGVLINAPDQKEEEDVVFLRLADTFNLEWLSPEELFKIVRSPEGASIKALFLVKLPPYVGGLTYRVPIRLFGKVNDNDRLWRVEMYAPQQTIDFAFNEAVAHVSVTLGIEPYYGYPEKSIQP